VPGLTRGQTASLFTCLPHRRHGSCTRYGLPGPVVLIRHPSPGRIRTEADTRQTALARGARQEEDMMAITRHVLAVQRYRVFIRAAAWDIWDALTRPGWTQKYGYRTPVQYDLRPGGTYLAFSTGPMKLRGVRDVIINGEVIEADPPFRLVQTWHAMFDARTAAEAATRLRWEIEEAETGAAALTVMHDLDGAPRTAALAAGEISELGGGWDWILSDLKTLLETGRPLPPDTFRQNGPRIWRVPGRQPVAAEVSS